MLNSIAETASKCTSSRSRQVFTVKRARVPALSSQCSYKIKSKPSSLQALGWILRASDPNAANPMGKPAAFGCAEVSTNIQKTLPRPNQLSPPEPSAGAPQAARLSRLR